MIIRSTSPDVAIPDVTITDFVLRQASRLADKPALIDGPSGRTLTYGALLRLLVLPDSAVAALHIAMQRGFEHHHEGATKAIS